VLDVIDAMDVMDVIDAMCCVLAAVEGGLSFGGFEISIVAVFSLQCARVRRALQLSRDLGLNRISLRRCRERSQNIKSVHRP